MTNTQTIVTALSKTLAGEPLPHFGSAEFRELVKAITALTEPGNAHQHERIGRKAMYLMLEHAQASMQGERALALMRDNGGEVC